MTAARQERWVKLNQQERAKQFVSRGIERTARAEIRTACDICGSAIIEGKYFDINGSKYAHQTCATADKGHLGKHGKIITHKMMEELSEKKSFRLNTAKWTRKKTERES